MVIITMTSVSLMVAIVALNPHFACSHARETIAFVMKPEVPTVAITFIGQMMGSVMNPTTTFSVFLMDRTAVFRRLIAAIVKGTVVFAMRQAFPTVLEMMQVIVISLSFGLVMDSAIRAPTNWSVTMMGETAACSHQTVLFVMTVASVMRLALSTATVSSA